MLDRLKTRGGAELERGFMVPPHDVRSALDRSRCRSQWSPGDWCYLGDPRTANVGPVGLARYTTLWAWLSQV